MNQIQIYGKQYNEELKEKFPEIQGWNDIPDYIKDHALYHARRIENQEMQFVVLPSAKLTNNWLSEVATLLANTYPDIQGWDDLIPEIKEWALWHARLDKERTTKPEWYAISPEERIDYALNDTQNVSLSDILSFLEKEHSEKEYRFYYDDWDTGLRLAPIYEDGRLVSFKLEVDYAYDFNAGLGGFRIEEVNKTDYRGDRIPKEVYPNNTWKTPRLDKINILK